MTNIVDFSFAKSVRSAGRTDEAIKRLEGIRNVLSGLDFANMRTQEKMTAALCSLTTANKCIKIVLDDFRETAEADRLVRHSENLLKLIEVARAKVFSLRPVAEFNPVQRVQPAQSVTF